jgi:hypothetical protein
MPMISRPPSDRICDPPLDIGFMPPSRVEADLDLSRERALGDLAVDGGSGQPCPRKDSFQTDDAVWFAHGRDAPSWLFPTSPETRQAKQMRQTRAASCAARCGVEPAANRMGQIPRARPLPRSMPWAKANSSPSRRPDSNAMPRSFFRLPRMDSSCGSRSRLLAMSPIADRVAL